MADRGWRGWTPALRRPNHGRVIAGVCAAIADQYAIDVTLLRIAFILLALASGIGVILYFAMWLVVPPEGQDEPTWHSYGSLIRANSRGMPAELRQGARRVAVAWRRAGADQRWPRPLSRRWIALGLMAGGGLIFLYSLGFFSWLGPGRALGLAIVALGAGILWSSGSWRRHGEDADR